MRALVPEADNDLFIVGDAHQRIYSRRAVLSQCNINVRGRSERLRINYRTTKQFRNQAIRALQDMQFDDLNGGKDTAKDISLLTGTDPEIHHFATAREEKEFLIEAIQKLIDQKFKWNEIAVLARMNWQVDEMVNFLNNCQIPAQKITTDSILEGEGVFCGTMHRSKGLEFRAVFLIDVNKDVIPPKNAIESALDEEEVEEIIKQERSLLYVTSTRAREKLYILSYGTPSRLLQ